MWGEPLKTPFINQLIILTRHVENHYGYVMMIISDEFHSYDERNQEKRASEPLSIDQVNVWTYLKQYLDSVNSSVE